MELGFALAHEKDLLGGDVQTNVAIAQDILKGARGPKRDIVVLNSACALYCAQKVKNIEEGIHLAEHSIDSKKAMQKLTQLIAFTNGVRQ